MDILDYGLLQPSLLTAINACYRQDVRKQHPALLLHPVSNEVSYLSSLCNAEFIDLVSARNCYVLKPLSTVLVHLGHCSLSRACLYALSQLRQSQHCPEDRDKGG